MKRKCPHAIKASYGWSCKIGGKCPTGAVYINDRNRPCHIITPKVKVRGIKAHGWFDDGKAHASADKAWADETCFPCTITIHEKWLKNNPHKYK